MYAFCFMTVDCKGYSSVLLELKIKDWGLKLRAQQKFYVSMAAWWEG